MYFILEVKGTKWPAKLLGLARNILVIKGAQYNTRWIILTTAQILAHMIIAHAVFMEVIVIVMHSMLFSSRALQQCLSLSRWALKHKTYVRSEFLSTAEKTSTKCAD